MESARNETKPTTPAAGRPDVPAGYQAPDGRQQLLPWEHARKRLEEALHYWVATVRPNGRPHVSPVWGVWLDDAFYFDGSPETRRHRNIAQNPAVAIHLEDGANVVIVEGEAEAVDDPPRSLTTRLAQGYSAKYAALGYAPQPDTWDAGGLYRMRPRKALAWTQFPDDMTRWHF